MYIFISMSLGSGSERILLVIYVRVYCLCLPLKIFTFSGLRFRSLIYFVFIFVYGVRKYSNFIRLYVSVQFSQHHVLKRLSFSHCVFLAPLSTIRCLWVRGFTSILSILLH